MSLAATHGRGLLELQDVHACTRICAGLQAGMKVSSHDWERRREAGEVDVVLVENDALVRACLAEMLGDGGLRVTEAPSAAEALAAADAAGPSAVLVTDLHLGPGMDGAALIAALRERRPWMRAVLISGGKVAEGTLDPRDAFLPKPFHGEALVRAIEAVRGDAAGP